MSDKRRGMLAYIPALLAFLAAAGAALGASAAGWPAPARGESCAELFAPPADQAVTTELMGISARGAGDVWAVGSASGPTPPAILSLHWNGASWQKAPLPQLPPGTVTQWLDAVAHAGPDVWAVGAYGTREASYALTMRWNGGSWRQIALPAGLAQGILRDVGGSGPDDVWAVGNYYDFDAQVERLRILHWNGVEWRAMPVPDPGRRSNVLNAVSARTREDAWAVGGAEGVARILHWDGTGWSAVDFATTLRAVSLSDVVALAPDDVWAVGRSEAGPLVAHWDGQSWQAVPVPPVGEFPSYLAGIAAVAENDVWAVGSRVVQMRPTASEELLLLHWDGQAWANVPVSNPGPRAVAAAVTAAGDGSAWVAGSYFSPAEQRTAGLLYRLTKGACPTPGAVTPSPTTSPATPPPGAPGPPPHRLPGEGSMPFPETGQVLHGIFLDYWRGNGGLAQQGYPISGVIGEVSELDGKAYTVQYFERAVFEYHPENEPPYQVLLSHLGKFRYREKYPAGAPNQRPNQDPGSVLFPATGKRLGGRFLAYWRANGGLLQQGYPLSDEFTEVSPLDGRQYTVQYFERAVFEWHPENEAPYDVLLSQLGSFRWAARYGPR